MKIRAIILSALILCGISAVIMYSRAAQPLQKSSVITQAINDKNTPMVIKNLILKMKEQMEVNDDQFPELIKEVENYTNSCADSASVAVLHSMLAEMYQNYYQRNQWTINQRTQLSGYIPEDIRVWTSNLFTDKIKEEIGWYPETMFAEGIKNTIKWYLEHEDWMANVTSGDYQKYYEEMYRK